MGATNSRIEEDKALTLCRERKRLVRQALDERCSLAAAHVSYIRSLRETGIALREFVETDAPNESSLFTPTSATPEPLALTDTPKHIVSQTDEIPSSETPPTHSGTTWDFFAPSHPIDNQLSFQNGRGLNRGFDNADEIRRLREEEGIPELEEDGDRASTNEENDLDSEDDFDHPSSEPLVQMFENRNLISEHLLKSESAAIQSEKDIVSETKHQNGDDMKLTNDISETTDEMTPTKAASYIVAISMNGKGKETDPETKNEARDPLSCMLEIADLFLKASESGKEIPMMLEANKVQFRPLFAEEKAHASKVSAFIMGYFACCKEETPHPQVSATNEVKYLTWHSSVSSLSSSSRNFLGTTMKDDTEEPSSNLFNSICMNSGSHASTLDRLYAWERKLYDEIKACGILRRDYGMKCRLLRHRESQGENRIKIDKSRAAVKDLHSRIHVAIQSIDSISKKIEEIRDKELQPQLEELIGGLTKMWRTMLDYHNRQYNIIMLVSDNGNNKVSVRSESQHQAADLEFELNELSSNFTGWMSAHKSYVQAINGWLLKCIDSTVKQNKSSRRKAQRFSLKIDLAPPIFVTCQNWLDLLEVLSTEDVVSAVKDLVNATTHFLPHQEKGHGTSKSSFSLPRNDESGEHVLANDSSVDWSLNYDHLQSALKIFLDSLKAFAASSVSKYEALQVSIKKAKELYEGKAESRFRE
ncbi:protein ALTERED PHOSPHATE STARVATION RESPONSE 1-like [Musa acuminata AAA Group]|uniref:protein ALTERED PHOSPHATE STARVATION RESPONSE 1-like n=1 Tax=Musa acuminata AAA Group TaxID=214697 RepID=UPI0031D23F18